MRVATIAVPLLTIAALAGCGRDEEAEPAPLSAMPPVVGRVLGPQPGPDRPLPTIENPLGMGVNVLAEGRRLFIWYNCYGCHGGHAGGGMGPSLRDVEWLYGRAPVDIYNSIAEGRPHGMPAWGTKLPSEQIWKLTAYIMSLDTDREPSPPPPNPVFPNPPPRRNVEGAHAGGGEGSGNR